MTRLSHDQYFFTLLPHISARSTCARRAVGAIIVDERNQILSTGYNGVPRSFTHCIDMNCAGANDVSGDTRRCMAVHAELNAVLQCTRLDMAHTLYVSCHPCFECAKVIANTKIVRVVYGEAYPGEGVQVLLVAGIKTEKFSDL